MKRLVCIILRAYQWVISPCLHWLTGPGSGCRFFPSCSEYCLQAVEGHGVLKGSLLGVRRLCRCHPWSEAGYDPVPGNEASSISQ